MTLVHRGKLQPQYSSRHGFLEPFSSPKEFEINQAFIPVLNIFENKDSYNIQVELPGLKKEEIELHIDSHYLILKGERKQEFTEKAENILVNESSYGSFYRSFPLPDNVDTKQEYKAKLGDGILSIVLPKQKSSEPMPKSIPIETI